jgi:PAS domain S-box-containing protein
MSRSAAAVRVALLEPSASLGSAGSREALERLGPEMAITPFGDVEACLAEASRHAFDLIVLDLREREVGWRLLEGLGAGGPPVVAVLPREDEAVALEAFRRGVADCVVVGPDFAELLASTALEQMRRWRVARDHSRLRRSLIELKSYNENIIHNMNSALLVVDREATVTYANPLAERIAGREPGSLIGVPAGEVFPEPAELPVWRTLREGVRSRGVEAVLERPGGGRLPVGMSCSPMSDAHGERLGAVVLFQDLSGIKQLERQVLQAEKLASVGQLAAGVAHEINNPMGFIHANLAQMAEYVADLTRLFAEVDGLRKAVSAGDLEAARLSAETLDRLDVEVDSAYVLSDLAKAVRESQEGSERIRHIVQDLRAFSHEGHQAVPADLNQCLDSTANIAWTMMKHSVELQKDYGELPLVTCYPRQMQQVFMNLLVNAGQAIESVRRDDVRARGRIRLHTRVEGDDVVVSVSDSGPGIPPEHLDRLFEPFFTTKEVGEGTGLGLSTSYDIVRRHGGSLVARSHPGRGAVFEIRLPIRGAVPE